MDTRRGFTLVEILTVIVIIGILVTLVTAAAAGALRAAKRGKIALEMSQIAMALERYKAEFGEYPPDWFDSNALVRHVKKRWPRMPDHNADAIRNFITMAYTDAYRAYTGDNTDTVDFEQPESLIGSLALWLGGFPNSDGKLSGFYSDPEDPFTPVFDEKGKPIFDNKVFVDLELKKNVRVVIRRGVPVPVIGNEIQGVFVPFVYFRGKAAGGSDAYDFTPVGSGSSAIKEFDLSDYDSANLGICVPYAEKEGGSGVVWQNPTTYQLIHPGLDGNFGETNSQINRITNPGTGIGLKDLDNITNFSDYKELKSILP